MSNYVEDVKVDKAMEGAPLADGLDPDSAYLDAQRSEAVAGSEALPDGEVGIELTRQYYLRVIAARTTTGGESRAPDWRLRPSHRHEADPRHVGVRGFTDAARFRRIESHADCDSRQRCRAARRCAGAREAGGTSGGVSADRYGCGLLRVASFKNGSVEDIKKQTADLAMSGAKSLLIDLRHTAEGPLDNGVGAARLFVKSGTLAVKAGREKTDRVTIAAVPTMPSPSCRSMLVTNGTSGAAELFIAALDGNDRGDIVGERTLGRAGVQKLVQLPENRGLWLTYAKYLTPKGDPIQGRGIRARRPDRGAQRRVWHCAAEKDVMLDTALEHLRKKAA